MKFETTEYWYNYDSEKSPLNVKTQKKNTLAAVDTLLLLLLILSALIVLLSESLISSVEASYDVERLNQQVYVYVRIYTYIYKKLHRLKKALSLSAQQRRCFPEIVHLPLKLQKKAWG